MPSSVQSFFGTVGGAIPPAAEWNQHEREFREVLADSQLDAWGHVWARGQRIWAGAPWTDPADVAERPLLMLDETYDEKTETFVYGALPFGPWQAITKTTWYLEQLLKIRKHISAFWPRNEPPPRLHLRELWPESARIKTRWTHLPLADLESLIRLVVAAIQTNEARPHVMPVPDRAMSRAVERAFPGRITQQTLPDLQLQAAAGQFRIAMSVTLNPTKEFEVVIDHDATKIAVGPRRRQATIRFAELLTAPVTEPSLNRPVLFWQSDARHSSKFPARFSFDSLVNFGHRLRPLIDAVLLQFVDVYVGIWRQLSYHGGSPLKIAPGELGPSVVQATDWI